MGLCWLDRAHNLNWNRLWQKQPARWRCILLPASPLSFSGSLQPGSVPSDILPAGCFYLLWDFTLTSWTSHRAGNTKATFQSSLKDNGLPCHFSTSPIQEINSSTGKSNNLRRKQRNQGDLTIPFHAIRRSGDELSRFSSASHPRYHPPTGWQTQTEGSLGKQIICCASVWDLTAVVRKIHIKSFTKWQQRWKYNWMELNQNQLAGEKNRIRKSHFISKKPFSWRTRCI